MFQDTDSGDRSVVEADKENLNGSPKKPDSSVENKGAGDDVQMALPHFHPLRSSWTLWYLEYDVLKKWAESQNEIVTIHSVEDFWNVHNFFKPPSQLKVGADYSLFKKGILPMWEDPANINGGRWIFTLSRSCRKELDEFWLNVQLFLIGEYFTCSDDICGAVLNVRARTNKISLWTTNGSNEKSVHEIGNKLKECLGLPRQNLQYQLHRDSMSKGSHFKATYVV